MARVPARVHGRGEGGARAGRARPAPAQAAGGLARLCRRSRLLRPAARAGLRGRDPRLRHRRPLRDRSQARRSGGLRPPGGRGRPPWPAHRARRGVQPRRPLVPGVPGRAGRRSRLARRPLVPVRRDGRRVRHVRGPRRSRRPGPRRARGRRLRRPGHDLLAGPGRGGMAARRRLRGAGQLLGQGAAGRQGGAPRRLVPRRDDPRRLRGLRGGQRPGLDHPVRAVEGDLELAQRPELLRAGLGARPGTTRCSTA